MKKYASSIALILCLVLCAFAFASCGKKSETASTTAAGTSAGTAAGTTAAATTAAATTAPATTTAHVHTPGAYEVLTAPTCSAEGWETQYCVECGTEIPGAGRAIQIDPEAHVVPEWDITPATMFSDGLKTGRCTECGHDFETVLTFTPTVVTVERTGKELYGLSQASFSEEILAGEKHFYPTESDPDGNDLYIEFSILWNRTQVDNLDGYMITGVCSYDYKSSVKTSWMALCDGCGDCWCPYAGGFETCDMGKIEEGPATMGAAPGPDATFADYPNFTGTSPDSVEWGWHRITIRLRQTITNEDLLKADETAGATAAQYKLAATYYFDGVKAFELSYNGTGNSTDVNDCRYWGANMAKGLYSAESNGEGGITYTDANRGLPYVGVAIEAKAKAEGTPGYVVLGDVSFTCGKAPAMNVVRVDSPAPATLTVAEGVDLNAAIYFKLAD